MELQADPADRMQQPVGLWKKHAETFGSLLFGQVDGGLQQPIGVLGS